ncbi:aldolase [Vibrio algivorus]|uniref:3-oxo-tetronate 4-phosphate decarboxylase n=1 Tax=Vibrio algivorus TaxID=1667024 RepID=A0ABQ6EKU9_9VIBR|nr:aldolase [Vibrio algivorus]GLT13753.1 class II aldolase [Vibrio algivorus]
MTEYEQRLQLVSLAKSMFDRGYATGGAGNISVKINQNKILATPTGSSFGRLDPERLSIVTLDGEHLSGDKPSKEVSFHIEVYKHRPEANSIVHLHSTYLTALSCQEGLNTDNAIKPFTPYFVMRVGSLPVVEYLNPGDKKIGEELAKLAPYHRAYLLANHGPVVTGKDLLDAADNAEELEETAKLYFLLQSSCVSYLSEENIAILRNKGV